jgi:hypothetical protein
MELSLPDFNPSASGYSQTLILAVSVLGEEACLKTERSLLGSVQAAFRYFLSMVGSGNSVIWLRVREQLTVKQFRIRTACQFYAYTEYGACRRRTECSILDFR